MFYVRTALLKVLWFVLLQLHLQSSRLEEEIDNVIDQGKAAIVWNWKKNFSILEFFYRNNYIHYKFCTNTYEMDLQW